MVSEDTTHTINLDNRNKPIGKEPNRRARILLLAPKEEIIRHNEPD